MSNTAFRRRSVNSKTADGSAPNIPNAQGGVRTMSKYGNKDKKTSTADEEDSDDEDDSNVLSTYEGFGDTIDTEGNGGAVSKFDDSDVFRSVSTTTEIKRLPPINKDRDKTKRENNFIAKLEQCSVVFDFRPSTKVPNPSSYATWKQVKKNALTELISYVMNNKDVLNERTLTEVVKMLELNLFRTFTTAPNPHSAPFDPEDDEPILEPAWPHLHLVYTLFLRCLESKSVTSDLYARVVETNFIRQFMELCGSCDPRERNLAKSCIHKMYGRFMPIRGPIRRFMQEIFIRHSNSSEQFHGIAEILEFYGCIVSGFVSPIKEEHQRMLLDGLMPLHRPKSISGYHRQLVHCVTQFLQKDSSLAPKVLGYVYRYWPKNNSPKQVLFLNELQSFSQALGLNFPDFLREFCVKIAACTESVHFMVAERSLAYFHLQSFVRLVHKHAEFTYPILVPAIHRNSKRHWSGAIHDHNEFATEVLQSGDPDLFQQFTNASVNAHDHDHDLVRAEVEDQWDQLLEMAKANPLAKSVDLIVGVPQGPAQVPDIFMKGETTSPKRQTRMHKRDSVVRLAPLRNKEDVSAMEKDKKAEEELADDFDDEENDNDDEDSMVVPDNPASKLLMRKKSTLHIPGKIEVQRELSNFQSEALDELPSTPNRDKNGKEIGAFNFGGDATETPPPSVDPPPPVAIQPIASNDLDEVDDWVPLSIEPSCTDGCWMVKRKSGMFKRSRRRWFAIETDRSRIAYYVDSPNNLKSGESLGDARGTVDFLQIMEVTKGGRQLFISTKDRKFALTSDSPLITEQWANTLGLALESHDKKESVFAEEDDSQEKPFADDDGLPTRGGTVTKRPSTPSDFFGFDSPKVSDSEEDDPARELSSPDDLSSTNLRSPNLSRVNSLSGLRKSLDVEEEGAGRLVTPDSASEWYAGKMSKKACEVAVVKAGDGDFLVREHKAGGKFIVCVNDNGVAANYSVKHDTSKAKQFSYGGEARKTLDEIIDLMRTQPPVTNTGRKLWLMAPAEIDGKAAAVFPPTPQLSRVSSEADVDVEPQDTSPTKPTPRDDPPAPVDNEEQPSTPQEWSNDNNGVDVGKTNKGIRGRNGSFYGFEDDDMDELEA